MHSGLRLSAALALNLTLVAGACAPQQPPALATPEVKAVAIPMPAPPKDTSLFAYLKIRDLKQTIELFGGPAMLGPLAARGLDMNEVQAGKPAALFLWDPGNATSPAAVPAVALLPVVSDGMLVTGLKATAPTVHVEASGDGTLAAMNPVAADHAREQLPALQDVLAAQLPFDGMLYLNAATIVDKYAPILRQGMRGLEPMLAMSAMQRKDAPSPRATIGMLEKMVSSLETLGAVAIGIKPYDGGIELSTMVRDRQPSQGGPVAAADLVSFLPPADVRIAWNSRDLKKTIDFYMGMYGPMLDEKPGLRAQVQALVDEWLKMSHKLESAASFSLGGEKGLSSQGLMRVENPAAMLDLMRKMLKLFNEGPIHESYKAMGIDFQIQHQPKTRKIKGWPVDRFTYKLTVSQELAQNPAKGVWDKMANTTYEVAQIGPYLVYASNASLDQVVNSLFTGKGQYPMRSTLAFPAGGGVYLDINVPSVLAGFKQMLPPNLAEKIPSLPPSPDPLTLWSYDSGDTAYYKVRIPGLLLATIKNAMK